MKFTGRNAGCADARQGPGGRPGQLFVCAGLLADGRRESIRPGAAPAGSGPSAGCSSSSASSTWGRVADVSGMWRGGSAASQQDKALTVGGTGFCRERGGVAVRGPADIPGRWAGSATGSRDDRAPREWAVRFLHHQLAGWAAPRAGMTPRSMIRFARGRGRPQANRRHPRRDAPYREVAAEALQ